MPQPFKPYIPKTPGELWDQIGWMVLGAPMFEDETGYFPGKNLATTFAALDGGIEAVRGKVGEERYVALKALAARMRPLFEADPEDRTGEAQAGRRLLFEMEAVLRPNSRLVRSRSPDWVDDGAGEAG